LLAVSSRALQGSGIGVILFGLITVDSAVQAVSSRIWNGSVITSIIVVIIITVFDVIFGTVIITIIAVISH